MYVLRQVDGIIFFFLSLPGQTNYGRKDIAQAESSVNWINNNMFMFI